MKYQRQRTAQMIGRSGESLKRFRQEIGQGSGDVSELLLWLSRDPLRPRLWKVLAIASGLIVSQYLQVAGLFALTYAFFHYGQQIGSSLAVVGLGPIMVGTVALWILSGIAVTCFVAQILVSYICRTALLKLSMGYYHDCIRRAITKFSSGLVSGGNQGPLLSSNLVSSFALREARYIGTGFLSLANLGASIVVLTIAFITLLLLNWTATLSLAVLAIALLPLQFPILRKSMDASRDILAGSTEFASEIRNQLGNISQTPLMSTDPFPGRSIESLDGKGANRFLGGFQRRLQLGYQSLLIGQATYATLLTAILMVFLYQMSTGHASASQIVRYIVLLGPAFTSLNAIITATIGITAAKPYFQSYLDAFPDPKSQMKRRNADNFDPGTHPAPERTERALAPVPVPSELAAREKLPTAIALFPADIVEWPEFLRMRSDLEAAGLLPIGFDDENLMLISAHWPDERTDINQLLGIDVSAALTAQRDIMEGSTTLIDELIGQIDGARGEDGLYDLTEFTPRDRVLIGLLAGNAAGRALLIPQAEFLRMPERERIFVVSKLSQVPIIIGSARIPRVQFIPQLDKAIVFFGDGAFVDIDPATLTEFDPVFQSRLADSTIHVRTLPIDPADLV